MTSAVAFRSGRPPRKDATGAPRRRGCFSFWL